MIPPLIPTSTDGLVAFLDTAPAVTKGAQGYASNKPCGTLDVVGVTDVRCGAARYTEAGKLRLYDATVALPAGSLIVDGYAMSLTGQLCVFIGAVVAATYVGGIACKQDGRVFASVT